MKLYLTWASGITESSWEQFRAFFCSVHAVLGDDEFVCLTDDLSDEFESRISGYGCRVVRTVRKSKRFFTNRWHAYWTELVSSKCSAAVITDSRDVVVQASPWGFLSDRVRLVSEGFAHGGSAFNMSDQMRLQTSQGEDLQNFVGWRVVNGGICMGVREALSDFCFLMWSNCLGRPTCTDQAVMNLLAHELTGSGKVIVSDPRDDNFCITGEGIKENLLPFEARMVDGAVRDRSGKPFAIFHQWDRTIFKNQILNSFLK